MEVGPQEYRTNPPAKWVVRVRQQVFPSNVFPGRAAAPVGRRFRILTLVDDFTGECLGLVVDTSLTGPRVARELDRIAELRG
jgi:transposase InsO family protein